MAEHVIKLPDIGEGIAEAEIVAWHVKVGDLVREDAQLADVMTDKATVEMPSPVAGKVAWLGAEVGDTVAVGSPLVGLEVAGGDEAAAEPADARRRAAPSRPRRRRRRRRSRPRHRRRRKPQGAAAGGAALAAAAAARRAPEGRAAARLARRAAARPRSRHRPAPGAAAPDRPGASRHDDLDAFIARGRAAGHRSGPAAPHRAVEEIKVVGLRRQIAEKMALAKRASRISPMSRNSTSPRSRSCARG